MNGGILKISRNEGANRTDYMEGKFDSIPEVGSRFVIFGAPIDKAKDTRMISTSEVKSVEKISTESFRDEDVYEFKTLNSTYRLFVRRV